MLVAIDRLREVSRRCLDREPLDDDLAEWLGDSLKGYLDRRHQSIGEAFGLISPHGGVPWWREEAIRRRNAALREMAELFYKDRSPCAQSRHIGTLAIRYAASAWRIDRNSDEMPRHYSGSVKEYLWCAFASGAAMPIGQRQLRNILGK